MQDNDQDNEKPVVKQVGERIARLRRGRGWKQRELASRIGCSLQQVSKLERGCWMPRVSVLVRVAETFNVTADYLLTGRGPRNPGVDLRLRERLPALEQLPEPQRDSLVLFLDGLIMAHRYAGRSLPAGEEGEGGPRQ
ncbi:MAG TPA: helix-turn-helix transcriptional regulator [Thermoanaerobaculia bacterium]|nr:helix-turn-helix transcriptional regulator [Thermoanaerobaculia bacterium]